MAIQIVLSAILVALICNRAPATKAATTASPTKARTTAAPTEGPNEVPAPASTTAVCSTSAEVTFVLDASSSVGSQNFENMLVFTQNVTGRLKNEYTRLNVTVITFSDNATVAVQLDESFNILYMKTAIGQIQYTHGGTNTHLALKLMSQSFHQAVYGRKIGILVTDGSSFEPDKTFAESRQAKNKGTAIFVVGVGDEVNTHEAMEISSEPHARYFHSIGSFTSLGTIVGEFNSKECLQAHSAVCNITAEVIFVLDASSSVGHLNFDKMLVFTQNVSERLKKEYTGLDLTVITFSNNATLAVQLDKAVNISYIQTAIGRIKYTHGGTNTHLALKLMSQSFHQAIDGPKIAILITDGSSFETDKTLAESTQAKDQGTVIFVVGVGDEVNKHEAMDISSEPHSRYFFSIGSFTALDSIVGEFHSQDCRLPTTSLDTTTVLPTTSPDCLSTPLIVAPTFPKSPESVTSTTAATTTTANCIAKVADIVFVVDSSRSIGLQNFENVKSFIKAVINTFEADDPRYTRVGLIGFSTTAQIQFKLGEKANLTELMNGVSSLPYLGGGTTTSDALELMRMEGFDRERPDAPDVAIVITDGLSKYPALTRIQAALAKDSGITIFAIGIGNDTDHNELRAMASDTRFVFEVGAFSKLGELDNVIAHMACGVNLPDDQHTRASTTLLPTLDGCFDLAPDCDTHPRDFCTDYEPYARKNCAKTCRFCPANLTLLEPPCVDDPTEDCAAIGFSGCNDASLYEWTSEHCPRFCGFCTKKTDPLPTDMPITEPPPPSACKDKIDNCSEFGAYSLCTSDTYEQWAHHNCPSYCGYCYDYHNVTSQIVARIECPTWTLPSQCSLIYKGGQCCPYPECPDNFRLTVKRRLTFIR